MSPFAVGLLVVAVVALAWGLVQWRRAREARSTLEERKRLARVTAHAHERMEVRVVHPLAVPLVIRHQSTRPSSPRSGSSGYLPVAPRVGLDRLPHPTFLPFQTTAHTGSRDAH